MEGCRGRLLTSIGVREVELIAASLLEGKD